MRAKFINEHISFEKPSSEKDFKDNLFPNFKPITDKKLVKYLEETTRPITDLIYTAKILDVIDIMYNIQGWYHIHNIDANSSINEKWKILTKILEFSPIYHPVYEHKNALWAFYWKNNPVLLYYDKRGMKIQVKINFRITEIQPFLEYLLKKITSKLNENINFEKPSSEKDFKDTLFKKYLKVKGPLSDGAYWLSLVKNYKDGIILAYAIVQNYFWTIKDYSTIEILDKYDIPYEIKKHHLKNYISEDDYIIIDGKYVDWGNYKPIKEHINFERPSAEKNLKDYLFPDLYYIKKIDKIAKKYNFYQVPLSEMKQLDIPTEKDLRDITLWINSDNEVILLYEDQSVTPIVYSLYIKSDKSSKVHDELTVERFFKEKKWLHFFGDLINENINFKKPESEEDYKYSIIPKKLEVVYKQEDYSTYHIKKIDSNFSFSMNYNKHENYFWNFVDQTYFLENGKLKWFNQELNILDKYNIPYIQEDLIIKIDGRLIKWEIQKP